MELIFFLLGASYFLVVLTMEIQGFAESLQQKLS